MITALITNKNSPKVTIVAGRVKKINNGLTVILNNPKTTATHTAVEKLETSIPGTICSRISTATAVNNIFTSVFIYNNLKIKG